MKDKVFMPGQKINTWPWTNPSLTVIRLELETMWYERSTAPKYLFIYYKDGTVTDKCKMKYFTQDNWKQVDN